MKNMETGMEAPAAKAGPRLKLHDRGPWIFALYWYSFQYRLDHGRPQRAMSFFGLSSTLRNVLLESERVAPLARRFDLRARVLMAICFIPGIVCLSSFIVVCGLPGHLVHSLREQYPVLGITLIALSLLSLVLMAVLTRKLHRSFMGLIQTYNASDGTDPSDDSNLPNRSNTPDRDPPDPSAQPGHP